jgi:hypothetical protein
VVILLLMRASELTLKNGKPSLENFTAGFIPGSADTTFI